MPPRFLMPLQSLPAWIIAAAIIALAPPALAQDYPNKPIRLVQPYPAGGPADLLARDVAAALAGPLGQTVIVEAKPGGGATIGPDFVAKSAPDGYTLLLAGAPSMVITPAMQAKPVFDGARDFTPIGMVTTVPNVIVVPASRPSRTIGELVSLAKSQPGKLSYGSPGNGSIPQLGMESLKRAASIDIVHIPYKGGGPVVTDLLGGQLDVAMVNLSAALPQLKAGKLRALALAMRERSDLLADLPTVAEAGLRTYDGGTWYALFGPANLPRPIVTLLASALDRVLAEPAFRDRLRASQGAAPVRMSPDELLAYLRKEQAELVPLVQSLGLKID